MLKKSFLVIGIVTACLYGYVAAAAPSRVILIRHAEKPADDGDAHLSELGRQRAQALPKFFKENPVVLEKPSIDAIIAMPAKKKKEDKTTSLRAVETVEPLAKALGKEIDLSFPKKQISVLAEALLTNSNFDGKVVVVCWNREGLPELAAALGLGEKALDWPSAIFNRAWIIDFSPGKEISFRDIPQDILPGDSAGTIPPVSK